MNDRERIEELEEEVAYLRSELGISTDLTACARIAAAFPNNRHSTSRMLYAMYRAYPRCLSKAQLFDTLRHNDDGADLKMVDIYVCHARKALGFDGIETHRFLGFSLSPKGYCQILHVLQGLRAAA